LHQAWDFSEQGRWKDLEVVTDRLNAPELIDFYEKNRFFYSLRLDHSDRSFALFKTNKGNCADVTYFTVYCLRKAGYKAYDHHVASPSGYAYHHVTLFEMNGEEYIMDNGRPDKRGIVPLKNYSPF
jgi:hypothetical protein